jgi:putative DNA primase/helicase
VIRLHPYQGDELILSEGVETALAAAEIFVQPCWTTVCAGGLRSVVLPDYVTRILIAADHDEAGRRCALAARGRWVAEGRTVRVKVPPIPGQDFNDVLLGRRRNAARP